MARGGERGYVKCPLNEVHFTKSWELLLIRNARELRAFLRASPTDYAVGAGD
jgi:hypothetical protein